jgi:hypothetical protein
MWFDSSEFVRAATEVHWLDHPGCKYVSLRVDQRTGDFIFQNSDGNKMTPAQVYAMFPALKGPGDEAAQLTFDPVCEIVASLSNNQARTCK